MGTALRLLAGFVPVLLGRRAGCSAGGLAPSPGSQPQTLQAHGAPCRSLRCLVHLDFQTWATAWPAGGTPRGAIRDGFQDGGVAAAGEGPPGPGWHLRLRRNQVKLNERVGHASRGAARG